MMMNNGDEQCTLRVHFCLLSWASSVKHQEIFKQVVKVRVVLKNSPMFPDNCLNSTYLFFNLVTWLIESYLCVVAELFP